MRLRKVVRCREMGGARTRHVLRTLLDDFTYIRATIGPRLGFDDLKRDASDHAVEGRDQSTYASFLKVSNEHGWEESTGLVRVSYIFESLGGIATCGNNGKTLANFPAWLSTNRPQRGALHHHQDAVRCR